METLKKEIRGKQFISTIIFVIIQMLCLISPYLMGKIIDDYIPNRKISYIITGIILFVSIPFITVLLQTGYNYFVIKFVRKKGNEFALKVMEKIIFREKKYFDKENSLELLSYTSKEAVGYINFYIADLSKHYVNIIISVIIFAILFTYSPMIALLQILYLPVAYFPVQQLMKNVDSEIESVLEKNAEINQIKGDVFKAIEFIKLNRLEQAKLNEVSEKNRYINGIWGKIAALDTLSGIWTSGLATVLFNGLTFAAGTIMILFGNDMLQVGQLVSIISYCSILYANINSMLHTSIDKKKKETEYSKIFSYLDFVGEREENENKKEFVFNNKIELKNCNFGYEENELVLKNLNMCLKKGCWTGIVGSSGSGKSTIFDLLLKLYEVSEGNVFIDSNDINNVNCFSIRENVTKIAQDIFLFPGTLEDNLKMNCPAATEKEIKQALEFACLNEYVESLPNGIKTDVGEAGKLMSGGERQRLSIAMGILRNNKILLLDEVTSSLDNETEAKLAENFSKLIKKGYTIISISHKLDFLKYADVVYEVKDGEATVIK